MAIETRTTDAKARVRLPKGFANATVIVEQVSDTEVRVRKALVIPADEIRFYEESASPLSDRDRDLFLALLDNPSPANEALRRAAARHPEHDDRLAGRAPGSLAPAERVLLQQGAPVNRM